MPTFDIPASAVEWLRSGERGLSSEAIFLHLTGLDVGEEGDRRPYPLDPADLRRCVLLLDAVPEFAARLDEMRTASTTWSRLVDVWPELVAMLREEMAAGDKAPRTYDRIQEVLGR